MSNRHEPALSKTAPAQTNGPAVRSVPPLMLTIPLVAEAVLVTVKVPAVIWSERKPSEVASPRVKPLTVALADSVTA